MRSRTLCLLSLLLSALAGRAEIYVSTDAGETWNARGPRGFELTHLVPDAKDPAAAWGIAMPTVAKPGEDLRFASPAVLRTVDGGKTWEALESYKGPDAHSIAVDPENAEIVYVGTTFGRIEKSADGGKTWTLLSIKDACRKPDGTPATPQDHVRSICVKGDRIVAGGEVSDTSALSSNRGTSGSGWFVVSDDGGKSWTAFYRFDRLIYSLVDDRILIADVYGKAECSSDGGKTWKTIREMIGEEAYPCSGHSAFSRSPDGKEVVFYCHGETRSSVEGGEWKAWPASVKDAFAECVAWTRPRKLAIFQTGEYTERHGQRVFQEHELRTLRASVASGDWIPVEVPDGKRPISLMTACDGAAVWLIAK